MKLVKIVFIGIFVLMASIFAGGYLLPSASHVERSINIKSNAATVFPYLNSMKRFQEWSPWAKMDPNTTLTYFGSDQGVGAGVTWSSENKKVGKGEQTIVESIPLEYVKSHIVFADKSSGAATLNLVSSAEGVQVVWGFDMEFGMNPIMRYIGLMMDGMLGGAYEQGLRDLKTLVESQTKMDEPITNEVVHYQLDGVDLTGYIAFPEHAQRAPAVLVVHEWWGHNDYARKRADMLAKLGYVAFALDMYGGGKVTGHPKEANGFMMEVFSTEGLVKKRFMAAYDYLKQNPRVSSEKKIAAIGYCFGGGVVLSMARSGVPLAGVASFHGSLQGLAPIAESAQTPAIVFNGADDPFITQDQINAFKAEMDNAGMHYQFVNYPGAMHGFTNPAADEKGQEYGLPLKYNADADLDSWAQMTSFLDSLF